MRCILGIKAFVYTRGNLNKPISVRVEKTSVVQLVYTSYIHIHETITVLQSASLVYTFYIHMHETIRQYFKSASPLGPLPHSLTPQHLQKGLTLPASISMNSGTRRRATGTARSWVDSLGSSLCIVATISSSILSLPPRRGS